MLNVAPTSKGNLQENRGTLLLTYAKKGEWRHQGGGSYFRVGKSTKKGLRGKRENEGGERDVVGGPK